MGSIGNQVWAEKPFSLCDGFVLSVSLVVICSRTDGLLIRWFILHMAFGSTSMDGSSLSIGMW